MGTIASLQKQAVQSVPDDPDLIGFLDTALPEPPTFERDFFNQLLLWATDHDISDLTIQAGNFIFVERFGRLSPVTRRRWTASEAYQCAQSDLRR
ncbi:MAG: hypothetical protein IPL99_27500 [Candidatus Competibacteraceae bacterium]|nr:hypothetical protein [Candidatus Competibacteraceae bacterium]